MYTNNNNGSFGGLGDFWGEDSSDWDEIAKIIKHKADEDEKDPTPKGKAVDPESYIPKKLAKIDSTPGVGPESVAPKFLASPTWVRSAPLVKQDNNPPPGMTGGEPQQVPPPVPIPQKPNMQSLGDWLGGFFGDAKERLPEIIFVAAVVGVVYYAWPKKKVKTNSD